MMDGADPAGEQLILHVTEPGGREPARQRVGSGELEHRLWQVGIGVPMFRHRPADRGEHALEVQQVQGAQRREPRRGELQHHETRTRPEHAVRLPQAGVQIREVPDPERAHGAVEPAVGEGQRQRVGADGTGARGLDGAFRELVRRHERPVFALHYRVVRDRGLAEDLAQETFIKVLNGIGSYNPQFRFSSWIFKIANNAAIDQLRKRELDTLSLDGSPHATTPEAMRATTPQLGDKGETPLQELEARELGGAIERAIALLRPEYRSCILLRHVEGHSYEEIARILELPLGTVKTYIHRARNELRGYLADRKE